MKRSNYLPAPQAYVLDQMCVLINKAFGDSYGCYLVGSSLTRRDYRDVDVRFIMEDAEYERLFGTERPAHLNPLWSLLCTSVSLFLHTHTGLPVDFQIQQASRANAEEPDGARHPLGAFICPTPRDYAAALANEPEAAESPSQREISLGSFWRERSTGWLGRRIASDPSLPEYPIRVAVSHRDIRALSEKTFRMLFEWVCDAEDAERHGLGTVGKVSPPEA